MADAQTNQIFEAWRKQFEEGAAAWARLVTQASQSAPGPSADPTAFWRPVLDQGLQTWARIFAQTPVSPDLMAQWKQFLDQWIDAWSRVLGQTMGTEAFAQLQGRMLDQWLTSYGPAKKMAEQTVEGAVQTLNLASRTQLTGVAKQIVDLEERVERIEDGITALRTRLDEIVRLLSHRQAAAPS